MIAARITSLLLGLAALATGQGSPAPALAVGDPAPKLDISKWLDGKPALELGKGRTAVLVFWAPWCGSCIHEFPHLNELVAANRDKAVTFVSITAEPEGKVTPLLTRRHLDTRVALDREHQTFDAYGVRVLPRLVLVDAAGRIAAMPKPDDLTQAVVDKLVAGEQLTLKTASQQQADLDWDQNDARLDPETSLGHILIERSSAASGAMRFPPGSGRVTADGVGFGTLLQIAYDARPHQVIAEHPAYDDHDRVYRLSIKAPDNRPETARAMLRLQLEHLFAYEVEWVDAEEKTPILRRLPEHTGPTPATADKASGMARHGHIQFAKVPFASIVQAIGTFGYGRAAVDETGLEGHFDIELTWTPGDAASLARQLAEHGLRIDIEPRKVQKLRVRERSD